MASFVKFLLVYVPVMIGAILVANYYTATNQLVGMLFWFLILLVNGCLALFRIIGGKDPWPQEPEKRKKAKCEDMKDYVYIFTTAEVFVYMIILLPAYPRQHALPWIAIAFFFSLKIISVWDTWTKDG